MSSNVARSFPGAAVCASLLLTGCLAAPPSGPDYREMSIAPPPPDKALVVVFRNHADPSGLAGKIDIADVEVMQLPEASFGFALAPTGEQALALRWPAASGTPGWEGTADWAGGQTYYYELTGTAGHGFYFRSQLTLVDARLAQVKLNACCKLNTPQIGAPSIVAAAADAGSPGPKRAASLAVIKPGMLQREVIDLIGAPDGFSSKYTGAAKNPLSFSADTFREYWSYAGVGFVVFSRNQYNDTARVIEIIADATARKADPATPIRP
jgi:hypothetical protein